MIINTESLQAQSDNVRTGTSFSGLQTQQNTLTMNQLPSQCHSVTSFAPTRQCASSWLMTRVTMETRIIKFVFVAMEMSTTTGLEEHPVLQQHFDG